MDFGWFFRVWHWATVKEMQMEVYRDLRDRSLMKLNACPKLKLIPNCTEETLDDPQPARDIATISQRLQLVKLVSQR